MKAKGPVETVAILVASALIGLSCSGSKKADAPPADCEAVGRHKTRLAFHEVMRETVMEKTGKTITDEVLNALFDKKAFHPTIQQTIAEAEQQCRAMALTKDQEECLLDTDTLGQFRDGEKGCPRVDTSPRRRAKLPTKEELVSMDCQRACAVQQECWRLTESENRECVPSCRRLQSAYNPAWGGSSRVAARALFAHAGGLCEDGRKPKDDDTGRARSQLSVDNGATGGCSDAIDHLMRAYENGRTTAQLIEENGCGHSTDDGHLFPNDVLSAKCQGLWETHAMNARIAATLEVDKKRTCGESDPGSEKPRPPAPRTGPATANRAQRAPIESPPTSGQPPPLEASGEFRSTLESRWDGKSADEQPRARYQARIAEGDHYNSKGVRLSGAASILRTDRANFHRFGKPNPEDESDPIFADKKERAWLEEQKVPKEVANEIVNGTPLIRVTVWSDRLDVEIISQ